MIFRKYMHLERYGNTEVEGIELGTTYVFHKLDGTCSQTYMGDDGIVKAGSRTRELTIENDNAGFCKYVLENENLQKFHKDHPEIRLFGEWLVPHSLKTYRDDTWRKFYVFDAYTEVYVETDDNEGSIHEVLLTYEQYQPLMEQYGIDYIPPIKIIKNGTYENFMYELENTTFLVKDGEGKGEGITLKNYDFKNRYGRTVWAKIVTSEFKEKHVKKMGAPKFANEMTEQLIVDKYVTEAFVEKEYAKIVLLNDEWNSKMIPQLLQTIFYSLITEECWNFVKGFKYPTINFKTLNSLTTQKIKEIKSNIF